MLITKQDLLLAYDIASWFFTNHPAEPDKKNPAYDYKHHQFQIPFYTLPFHLARREMFEDKATGIEGFTSNHGDTFIIAIDSTETDSGWRTNLTYFQKTMPYRNKKSKVLIHGAYANAWAAVRWLIQGRFAASGLSNVFVCGYSMGGGLAPIAALDMQYTFGLRVENIKCVIGDGPRVFNKAGMKSYNKRVPNTIRMKWGNDIVTKAPPPFFGFWHVGQVMHLGPREHWWRMSPFDHDPGRGEYSSIMYLLPDGIIEPRWLSVHR